MNPNYTFVIARGEAPRQSRVVQDALDCFASLAMTKEVTEK